MSSVHIVQSIPTRHYLALNVAVPIYLYRPPSFQPMVALLMIHFQLNNAGVCQFTVQPFTGDNGG